MKQEDIDLFRQTVEGVKELKQTNRNQPLKKIKKTQDKQSRIKAASTHAKISDDLGVEPEVSEDEVGAMDQLFFAKNGVQKSVLRKLKSGKYPMQDELDLHGLTSSRVYDELEDFILEMQDSSITFFSIVHGKGGRERGSAPVLKNIVNRWLKQQEEVLAFVSARDKDGGTGAVYVMLKNSF